MLTSDFSGTYDYEKEEAQHAAQFLLDDIFDGYLSHEEVPAKIEKERQHWKKCLPDTFEDWDRHFTAAIESGLNHALKGPKA